MTDERQPAPAWYAEVAEKCACMRLRQASRAITQLYDQALRPAELRATQFTVLVAIRIREPIPLSELAEGLVMDRTTLSRNLALLEERGLVRSRPGEDARVRRLATTARGRRVLEAAYPHWRDAQREVERMLGEAGVDELFRKLEETVELSRGGA